MISDDLKVREMAFDLLYGEVISCLNNPEAAGFTETECSAFRKDIRSCVDARETIEFVFIVSLLMERYEQVHFKMPERIVMAACVFMNRFIYRSTDGEYRCQCMDGIVEQSIGEAMEAMMREDPAAYGVEEGDVDFNADFVEKVYGGFKRIFQCFYPRIQW